MAEVTLSKAVRSNLLNLQSTATQLGKTQQRLATGQKVNSALDNPTNFFTASSLNSRAGDLGRLLDAVGSATQTIEAANNGLTAITKLVESAQATARQALQTTGQATTNTVTGATSATFNPAAFTTVSGDNDATGTNQGSITADAGASLNTATIAADVLQADFDFTSVDLGDETDVLDVAAGATISDGDIFTISVNGVDTTVEFADDGVGTGASDITVDRDLVTVAGLATALDAIGGISVTSALGVLTIETDAGTDTLAFTDNTGDPSAQLAFGTTAPPHAATTTGTADHFFARNSDIQALIAGGDVTLDVSVGGTAQTQITLGATGIASKEDLITALNNLADLTATGDETAGTAIALSATDSGDGDANIVLTASNAATATALFTATDSGSTTVQTTAATNLLSQSKVSQGDTIDIKVGSSATLTVTFGTSTGQVSTLGELNAALQNLAGGSASVDGRGEINITSDLAGDPIVIGGTTAALSSFGLTAGETASLIDGTNIAAGDKLNIQVGTNSQLTVTFGTGTGQVNTLTELETALGNLAGGTATINSTSGAITIEATNGSDDIVISSTNSSDVAKASVGTAFGLTAGTTTATTTDSTQRSSLETQYNDLLSQINELAEDASFNGVNLLDGNDLNVIFNEDASSKLDIQGVTFNSTGLGLSRVASGSFQTDANIDNVLTSLDSAISSLRSQATTFGSNLSVVETRQDFTKTMINTLETGAANLTLADTNEEAANLLALQTRQQLSSTALSLASQSDQNVLRLF